MTSFLLDLILLGLILLDLIAQDDLVAGIRWLVRYNGGTGRLDDRGRRMNSDINGLVVISARPDNDVTFFLVDINDSSDK